MAKSKKGSFTAPNSKKNAAALKAKPGSGAPNKQAYGKKGGKK